MARIEEYDYRPGDIVQVTAGTRRGQLAKIESINPGRRELVYILEFKEADSTKFIRMKSMCFRFVSRCPAAGAGETAPAPGSGSD